VVVSGTGLCKIPVNSGVSVMSRKLLKPSHCITACLHRRFPLIDNKHESRLTKPNCHPENCLRSASLTLTECLEQFVLKATNRAMHSEW